MALPKIFQMLFGNGGKGPKLRPDIVPVSTENFSQNENGDLDLSGRVADAASQSDILEAVNQATVGEVAETTLESLQAQVSGIESNVANIPVPVRYVTETWSDGTNWYTKYNDGWIEQGGYAEGITSLSFPLEFSNNKYVFIALPDVIDSGNAVWGVRVYDGQKTTTGITSLITAGSNSGWTGTQNFKGSWVAKGY